MTASKKEISQKYLDILNDCHAKGLINKDMTYKEMAKIAGIFEGSWALRKFKGLWDIPSTPHGKKIISEIRNRYENGESIVALAKEYKIGETTLRNYRTRQFWNQEKHLEQLVHHNPQTVNLVKSDYLSGGSLSGLSKKYKIPTSTIWGWIKNFHWDSQKEYIEAQSLKMPTRKHTSRLNKLKELYVDLIAYNESQLEHILYEHLDDMLTRSGDKESGYLTEDELKIIQLRFGLTPTKEDFTLEEVGDMMGITKERVRQKEFIGLRKLRKVFEMNADKY